MAIKSKNRAKIFFERRLLINRGLFTTKELPINSMLSYATCLPASKIRKTMHFLYYFHRIIISKTIMQINLQGTKIIRNHKRMKARHYTTRKEKKRKGFLPLIR
jgi:hypothetical protein